jgi:hypothetical protein
MVTRTLRGFRRWSALGRTRISTFAPVSRASDSGIPLALPMAVAAAIQSDSKPATERLEAATWMRDHVPKLIVYGARIQLPNWSADDVERSC